MKSIDLKIVPFKIQPSSRSILYRYITIDKLLDFLLWERIPLLRLNTFEDKLEGSEIEHLMLNQSTLILGQETAKWIGDLFKEIAININPTQENSLKELRDIFQETSYASCWYINDHESAAMWQLYSKPDSVAIGIPYSNLTQELDDSNFELPEYQYLKLIYGGIEYFNFNDLKEITKIVTEDSVQGFIKDTSFQHENEFRIMIRTQKQDKIKFEKKPFVSNKQIKMLSKIIDNKVIYLKFTRFRQMPFKIIFHPKSSSWHRLNIKKILDKFDLSFSTFESDLKEIFN